MFPKGAWLGHLPTLPAPPLRSILADETNVQTPLPATASLAVRAAQAHMAGQDCVAKASLKIRGTFGYCVNGVKNDLTAGRKEKIQGFFHIQDFSA